MILAGTGHRPEKLGGHSEAVNERLRRVLRPLVVVASEVISGMALGFDMALAEVAIELGIPLIAAIPFRGQESMWPLPSQERYRSILAKASRVVVVSEGDFAAWKMQKRNEWMVDNCEALLALWDGSPGGTANCLKYADRKRSIVNIWEDWVAAA